MTNPLATFQTLLRELFQFDCADLDFGIYRIMNRKREIIERFITDDLPKAVVEQLDSGTLAEQAQAEQELQEIRQRIGETLGDAAIDSDGNLVEMYHNTPLGRKYLELEAKSAGGQGRDALEAAIFNHLYAFFSRYYQDGDFISKRRYSKRQRYAIPYNGEEVHLHWANRDQYYIKTGEHFCDYSFAVHGVTVHFKLQAADVEQDNVKGDKRFFLPCIATIAWDGEAKQLDIPFEYRPLTTQEEITYGKKNQQEAIITKAVAEIPKKLDKASDALAALTREKRLDDAGPAVSFLEHHLRQYTRRNTSDFFIHKDLRGFLVRELDFYLKNEVLNLGDMEVAGEARAEGWFQMMRTIRSVGDQIIDFLDQIEGFQKMLWEKRKFASETHYCIAAGHIDEGFYEDIARCEAQWDEWKALFSIDEEQIDLFNAGKDKTGKRVEFLKAHPTLVLDSKHFDQDFVDRLLGSFDDLDEMTDGVLIHGENWQALNLLQARYHGQVQCIYIDPPYNTGEDGFPYKDSYQHSSWLAMMNDRLGLAVQFMAERGSFVCHIDEHEFNSLETLIAQYLGENQKVGPIIWDKRNPKGDPQGIATQHEYLCWAVRDFADLKGPKGNLLRKKENAHQILKKAAALIRKSGGKVTESTKDELKSWVKGQNFSKGEKAYCHLDDEGNVYRPVSMAWPNKKKAPDEYFEPLTHPITGEQCPVPERGWRNPPQTMENLLREGKILFGKDEKTQPNRKYILKENIMENVPSLYYFGGSDDALQKAMDYYFPNPKPLRMGKYITSITAPRSKDKILDYFAGSGTTAHAVINLNREDGGQRKFILVEMGEYFDTVLLPRIKKVAFTPEWKDGKPKSMATSEEAERGPRIVKYMRLESYEDALNNIDFNETPAQQALQFDDYLLKYMLLWETKRSATLLNVEKLSQPFCYTLHIHADSQTRQQIADIPETFNYLLGLRVETRRVYYDDDRRYLVYRGYIDQQQIVVIWRETQDWDEADLVRDKKFVAEQQLTDGADEVYVNGDSFIREAKALEPTFKRRMFAETRAS